MIAHSNEFCWHNCKLVIYQRRNWSMPRGRRRTRKPTNKKWFWWFTALNRQFWPNDSKDANFYLCKDLIIIILVYNVRLNVFFIHDRSLLSGSDRIEQFIFCDLCHQSMNEFDGCSATVPSRFCQLVFGAFLVRIAACGEKRKRKHNRNISNC